MFNWSRAVKLGDSSQVQRVSNVKEIQSLLKNLYPNQRIKVLGSGMSYLGIGAVRQARTEARHSDVLLDLSSISGLVDIGEDFATFGAATVLQEVSDLLEARGLQLAACPGVLMTQTLAGAIATGTHGQGLSNAGLYDIVTKVEAVLSDGSVQEFSRHDPNYSTHDNPFDGFRLHLGSLGILSSVTLECVPLKIYRLEKSITDFNDLQENFISWNETAEHCKAWWFPKTDHVQLWRSVEADSEEVETYQKHARKLYVIPKSNMAGQKTTLEFNQSIKHVISKMDDDTKSKTHSVVTECVYKDQVLNRHNARFDTVHRFKSLESCLGNLYQLWCKGIPAPQVNCELAIPLDRLNDALQGLRQYYQDSNCEMHYPFILRATGSSTAWLSPAYGRAVCYIGFLVYLSEDSYEANTERLQCLKDIEAVLAKYGAIPHYGKFMTSAKYDFPNLLPKWEQFRRLQKQLDPKGIFLNNFLTDLLGIDDCSLISKL